MSLPIMDYPCWRIILLMIMIRFCMVVWHGEHTVSLGCQILVARSRSCVDDLSQDVPVNLAVS